MWPKPEETRNQAIQLTPVITLRGTHCKELIIPPTLTTMTVPERGFQL